MNTNSAVVREAIRDYHAKSDRLTETERRRMLQVLEEYAKTPLTGTQADADREFAANPSISTPRVEPAERLQITIFEFDASALVPGGKSQRYGSMAVVWQ
jgi:hypothetical protein